MLKPKPKIIFVLNTFGLTGGIRVIFEHANHLAAKGYEVELIHLLKLRPGLINQGVALLKWFKYHSPWLRRYFFRPRWFNLRPDIKLNRRLNLKRVPIDALIIATANETADAVNILSIPAARKFYFIQDYETWARPLAEVDRTYSYDLQKIVISQRLQRLLKDKFNSTTFGPVSNGVNNIFFTGERSSLAPNSSYHSPRVLLLYHPALHKGFRQSLAAYEIIKKNFPTAELSVFGAYPLKPRPALVKEFYFQPTTEKIKELYNVSDIFIYGALTEGFALTPLEAMASGCAVVSSDVGAVSEYGQNGKNIIIVPVNDSVALAQAALGLLNNPNQLRALASAGRRAAQEFTWTRASDQLEKILMSR